MNAKDIEEAIKKETGIKKVYLIILDYSNLCLDQIYNSIDSDVKDRWIFEWQHLMNILKLIEENCSEVNSLHTKTKERRDK